MALQRANWLEKQPARSKMRAILQVIKSGTLWQTPWTDLPFGLNRDCSSEAQFHNAMSAIGTLADIGLCAARAPKPSTDAYADSAPPIGQS
jgi:hypothetical protein